MSGGKGTVASAKPSRALSSNMEDYLEAIYQLSEGSDDGGCRVSSIAEALGVKRPSVSKALKRLQERSLVVHLPYGNVRVTAQGKKIAQRQVRNHSVLTRFMSDVLGLSRELADHDACLMEHAISNETVERLVEFITHLESSGKKTQFDSGRKKLRDQGNTARPARSWKSRV